MNTAVLATQPGVSPKDLAMVAPDYVGDPPVSALGPLHEEPYFLRNGDALSRLPPGSLFGAVFATEARFSRGGRKSRFRCFVRDRRTRFSRGFEPMRSGGAIHW